MEEGIIVAIDGVGGAGKGTTAKGVAQKLNYIHFDSGALYRASSFFLNSKGIKPEDDQALTSVLPEMRIKLDSNGEAILNGENIEKEIRTERIDKIVPTYAKNPILREHIRHRQRELLKGGGYVIDGRDIGSVVFPEAELKIYITCEAAERARRRALQYGVADDPKEVAEIQADFEDRDERDRKREHSPLIIPKEAVIIDTTNLTIEEQIEKVYKLALEKIQEKNES